MSVLRVLAACVFLVGAMAAAGAPLEDLDGNPRALEEFTGQGQWTVVMIWASHCPVCNAEAYQYVDFHTFHKDDDARVLGISLDGPADAAARAFIARHGINFPNLIGEPAAVARLYYELTGARLAGTPAFLLFDPEGTVRARHLGAIPQETIAEFIAAHTP